MSDAVHTKPYEPFTPPVEPKVTYPRLSLLVQRVALGVVVTGYGAALGALFSLAGFSIAILDGALIGGAVGLLCSFAICYFAKLPTAIEGYRQDCLIKLESAITSPRAAAALSNLKSFFYYPLKSFTHYHQLPLLYNELAAVTPKLDRERRDVLQTWAGFLQHLNGLKVKMPAGEEITLDLSKELAKMQGKVDRVSSSWLTSYFSGADSGSLKEIEKIQKLTMGISERYSAEEMQKVYQSNKHCHIIASRQEQTGSIVGFGWYFDKGSAIEIAGLARLPEYARLGIGSELLQQMLKSLKPDKEVHLHVRKSSPAIRLFQKWGFEEAQVIKDHFHETPREDGILMKLNWELYQERLNQQ